MQFDFCYLLKITNGNGYFDLLLSAEVSLSGNVHFDCVLSTEDILTQEWVYTDFAIF